MDNKKIIEILEKEAGLTADLIFDPDKAEKFIAEVEKENPGRIAFLPVRPDWNETKKVFGYYNPLTGLFYPTNGLIVLLNAFQSLMKGEKDKKYFIILDEMNLARVEYYFSDILSLMENMWKIKNGEIIIGETTFIHPILNACLLSNPEVLKEDKLDKNITEKICWLNEREECKRCIYHPLLKISKEPLKVDKDKRIPQEIEKYLPIPPRIAYPENLVIIGTVNVDETTFSFAPKVLDRAFIYEFLDVNWEKYIEKLKEKFSETKIDWNGFQDFIEALQNILKPKNLHFGYRVIKEMTEYLEKTKNINESVYDFLLKSKVLPKIHGTEEQVGEILIELLKFCAKDDFKEKIKRENLRSEEEKEEIMESSNYRYSESAQKILQMYENMKATGYASFF